MAKIKQILFSVLGSILFCAIIMLVMAFIGIPILTWLVNVVGKLTLLIISIILAIGLMSYQIYKDIK